MPRKADGSQAGIIYAMGIKHSEDPIAACLVVSPGQIQQDRPFPVQIGKWTRTLTLLPPLAPGLSDHRAVGPRWAVRTGQEFGIMPLPGHSNGRKAPDLGAIFWKLS